MLILIAFVVPCQSCFFREPKHCSTPAFSLSREFLSSHQTVGRKRTSDRILVWRPALCRHSSLWKDICPFPGKKKRFTVQLECVALCLKPGITPARLSLLALCLSSTFWYLRGWLAGLGWGVVGGVGVRGLAGDELTGYYWLCGGLVHKSPLSPMAGTARTPANKIK